MLWNSDGQPAVEALRFDPSTTKMRLGLWMAGTNVAVVDLETQRDKGSRQEIWLCSFAGRPKLLYLADQGAQALLSVSPTTAVGVLSVPSLPGSDKAMSLITFGPNGEIGKPTAFPVDPSQQMFMTGFDASGGGPYVSAFVRRADGKIERKNFVVKKGASTAEPYNGDIRIGPEIPRATDGVRSLTTEPLPAKYGDGPTALWVVLGIGSDAKRLLITTDGEAGSLSPTGDTVAYVHAGCLLVRRLIDIPQKAYESAIANESQTEATKIATEAVRLLAILESTMNGRMPSVAEWDEYCTIAHVPPTVRSRFVFLGSARSEDAKSVAGYVRGVNGRAVVHGDLSVSWEP